MWENYSTGQKKFTGHMFNIKLEEKSHKKSFKALPVKTVKKPMCPNVLPVRVNHKYKQNENFRKYLLKKVLVNTCFDKVADPQTTTLSKK